MGEWNWGGPPPNMSPGQYMERFGSIGGGIIQEYTSVPTPDGDMLIQKTSEVIPGSSREIGHATLHPGAPSWNDHYPKK